MATGGGESVTTSSAGTAPGSSLRAFTSTAEVPRVPHRSPTVSGQQVAFGGRRPKAPLGLRLAVWATALLVVVGAALIWVNHQYPSVFHSAPAAATHALVTPSSAAPARPKTGTAVPSSGVVFTQAGPTSGSVTVSSAQYTVVVSAQAPCWVKVTTPGGAPPLYQAVMQPGAQQTFHPANGQLAVNLGASKVTVAVLVGGAHAPSWQWSPASASAPFQLSFTSTSG